jgi:hypothetical protein
MCRSPPHTARRTLVNAHAHQVRHDVGEAVVVIAFHPHDFDIALGIRQLADVAEKLPVVFGQAGEVKIGENVAQQNQPLKRFSFSTRVASRAWLVSAPRCRSERISVLYTGRSTFQL